MRLLAFLQKGWSHYSKTADLFLDSALVIDLSSEASGHLSDGRFVDVCKGLEHRDLHDPLQVVQPRTVLGKGVILRDTSEFASIRFDNGKITTVPEFGSVDGFSISHVLGDLGFRFLGWHSEQHFSRRALPGRRGIVDADVIPEEPGFFSPGMGDQRLFWGH